jgi:hypothetical protein
MALFAFEKMITPEAMADLRAHPDFCAAADDLVAASLREFAAADAAGRWMFRDLGRSSLYLACVGLDSSSEGLTAANLAAVARVSGIASRGRVMAFLRFAESAGEIVVPPGERPWTQRRLILHRRFIERFRRGNRIYADAVARLAPEMADLPARLDDDPFLQRFITAVGLASRVAAESGVAEQGEERIFLERDRGMSLLFRLLSSQPKRRARLLVEAPLSRSSLAREFDVSRAHINRLLADAEARGLLGCPTPDLVTFSEILSDAIERMIMLTLQITRAALLAASVAEEQGLSATN